MSLTKKLHRINFTPYDNYFPFRYFNEVLENVSILMDHIKKPFCSPDPEMMSKFTAIHFVTNHFTKHLRLGYGTAVYNKILS